MTKLVLLLAVTTVSLALLATFVFGMGDATLFVSPPEARAEGFARSIETGRYEQARQYLSDALRSQMMNAELQELGKEIATRFGEVDNVTGERLRIHGDQAKADAILLFRDGQSRRLHVNLVRENGEWNIADFRIDGSERSFP